MSLELLHLLSNSLTIIVNGIDIYFLQVRSFEAFKYLHVGMISDIKRKSLPAIAKVVGLSNEQGLLHFLTESPWKAAQLREERLELILAVLAGREIILIIDEAGDKKKEIPLIMSSGSTLKT